jgi:hypothetical protein
VPEFRVSLQRGREAEMDRIEDRVEDRRNAAFFGRLGRAQQGLQIAVIGRNEHRGCVTVAGDIEGVFGEAQQKAAPALAARRSSSARPNRH